MRLTDAMHAKREGLDAAKYRALRFAVPLLRSVAAHQADRTLPRSEIDTLLAAYTLTGEARAAQPTGSEPWAVEVAHDLAQRLWAAKRMNMRREHVVRGLRLVRVGWLAHCCERLDLARYMFAMASAEWLRANMGITGEKAGAAWLAGQRRSIAGAQAHGRRPQQVAALIRQAVEAYPDASNREVARLTGVPEATVRRHRKRIPQRKVAS